MMNSSAGTISEIYDAALEPGRWANALRSVAQSLGAVGCVYLVADKLTGNVRSLSITGPLTELKTAYVEHYASVDPFTSILVGTEMGRWARVKESVPPEVQRTSEWYNDFFLCFGIADLIGTRLFDDGRWLALMGVHEESSEHPIDRDTFDEFTPVLGALRKAAKLHHDLDRMGWTSTVALRALEQVATGVVITDSASRLIECNAAAERILNRNDGITLQGGMLGTKRVFETVKLAKLIAGASVWRSDTSAGHMLIARSGGGAPYAVTVSPLSADLSLYGQPLTMVLIANPDELRPSQKTLADLFGFSPAESHLAMALMRGRKLREIAQDRGVSITTVRTQMSSVLKKAGAERQTDLVRILAGAQLVEDKV